MSPSKLVVSQPYNQKGTVVIGWITPEKGLLAGEPERTANYYPRLPYSVPISLV